MLDRKLRILATGKNPLFYDPEISRPLPHFSGNMYQMLLTLTAIYLWTLVNEKIQKEAF